MTPMNEYGQRIAQRLAHLLPDPAAPSSIPGMADERLNYLVPTYHTGFENQGKNHSSESKQVKPVRLES